MLERASEVPEAIIPETIALAMFPTPITAREERIIKTSYRLIDRIHIIITPIF
jgi:hypothetical protein